MGRKTRREKEKAKLRRLMQLENTISGVVKGEFQIKQEANPKISQSDEKTEISDSNSAYSFVLRDLFKTVIVASLILALEIVLKFVLR